MKRLPEIMLFPLLTLAVMFYGHTGSMVRSGLPVHSSREIQNDTTGLISLLKVDSFRLTIVPPSSGVQFYKDGIVFLSMTKNEMKMPSNQISFGAVEAYYAPLMDSVEGRHIIFSPLSSFSFPCEAMTFSRDFNTVYFSKIPDKEKKEKIFMAKFTSDSKSKTDLVRDLIPLDFCTTNSSYTHPTLSSDEKILIFASDKQGSIGGMDLYISRRDGEKWSDPENLGESINTTGNEFFPFLDSENNLFFSSDKLPGYGGYDVFTSRFNGVNWDKPVNLSARINSNKDDIAFTINKTDGRTAFFTRRQKSGKGSSQLFRVTLKQGVPDGNLLTISNVFNEKPVTKTTLTAVSTSPADKEVKAQPVKTKTETKIVNKEEKKIPEAPGNIKKTPEKVTAVKTDSKTAAAKSTAPVSPGQKESVVYRVQILPNTSQKNAKEIVLNGTSYKINEYLYLGAIRYTIGEFSTLAPAAVLQNICRQSGYTQSFVVVFINNARSLDPKLFK